MFNWIRELKWFYQRGKCGWAECDAWDMDSYVCRLMPQMIRRLKCGDGCPSEFYDKEAKNNECHKWNDALEEMAQGFEAAKWIKEQTPIHKLLNKDGKKELSFDFKSFENAEEKMKKGLHLFADNFLALWD